MADKTLTINYMQARMAACAIEIILEDVKEAYLCEVELAKFRELKEFHEFLTQAFPAIKGPL